MKKLFVALLVLALLVVVVLTALASNVDRVCVQHKEGKSYVVKYVEPSSLPGHLRHGDLPCYNLTQTAEFTGTVTETSTATVTVNPTATQTPTPTPIPTLVYTLLFPFIAFASQCWWCMRK